MTSKLNRCYFQAASAGTGDFVYDETIAGYLSPPGAEAVNGLEYAQIAEVGTPPTEWEISIGIYDEGANSIPRTTVVESSNGGLVVDFSDPPRVRMGVPLAADFPGDTLQGANGVEPDGDGRPLNIIAGNGASTGGAGGAVAVKSGNAVGGNAAGGEYTLSSGDGAGTGNGGDFTLAAGDSGGDGGTGGNFTIAPGNGTDANGNVFIIVPTSDPLETGALWNNAGVLTVSAG